MIEATPFDTAFPLVLTLNQGQTGLAPVVALRQGANYLDFDDFTFKSSAWTTRQAPAAEVSPALSPGHYEYALDVTQLNPTIGEAFMVEYALGGLLYVSEMLVITSAAQSLNTTAIIEAINAQTDVLLGALEGSGCTPGPVTKPTVFTGHKGDAQSLPVYRGSALMSDAELVGSTSLVVNFYNRDTQANVPITVGITVGGGFVTYVTTTGDGVYESAGRWEAQAEGISATGEPFRSQVVYTVVRDEIQ